MVTMLRLIQRPDSFTLQRTLSVCNESRNKSVTNQQHQIKNNGSSSRMSQNAVSSKIVQNQTPYYLSCL